jgi:hypothetical protein
VPGQRACCYRPQFHKRTAVLDMRFYSRFREIFYIELGGIIVYKYKCLIPQPFSPPAKRIV